MKQRCKTKGNYLGLITWRNILALPSKFENVHIPVAPLLDLFPTNFYALQETCKRKLLRLFFVMMLRL